MNNELSDLEKAVLQFIKDYPGIHKGQQIAEYMHYRIENAVIKLVNLG